MLYWPALDRWPPSKKVICAAAVMTFVIFPLALFLGMVGAVIYGGVIVVAILFSMRLRIKQVDARAEELRRAGPED